MNDKFSWRYLSIAIVVCMLYILWTAYRYSTYNTSIVYSRVNGEPYLINNAHDDIQTAADNMATVHEGIITLLRHLRNKYTDSSDPNYVKVQFLLNNFNPDALVENSPHNIRNYTSYTENKGQTFNICLRHKYTSNNEFIDTNTIMFVVIHEISHLFTDLFGHDKPFWKNFKFLLGEAVEIGLYKPVDYMLYPIDYCGLALDYSPYFDESLKIF